jgi:formate-dependent nitrite reductase membrane component NrfD
MADRDVPYHADWAKNIAYRRDPNRVEHLPAAQAIEPAAHSNTAPPSYPSNGYGSETAEPSYYDISMLKAPVWGWEIAAYFYLGGISAGSFLIARAAHLMGDDRYKDVSRAGAYLSLLTLLPCPPLLIHDLGDPKRFHHMLRVWKPSSPMNLGTWALTAYSGAVTADVVHQYLSDHPDSLPSGTRAKLAKLMNNGTLLLLRDAAGIPLALLVAGYTGVLLSCTANPLWCQNPWLSPLFAASAISSGAQALSLTLDLTSKSDATPSQTALQRIGTLANVAEGVALAGFNKHAGEKAAVLRTGKQASTHAFAIGATVAATVLRALPVPKKLRKPVRILASLLGLSSAFAMRWAMVHGGHGAANDPRTARLVSKPKSSENNSARQP